VHFVVDLIQDATAKLNAHNIQHNIGSSQHTQNSFAQKYANKILGQTHHHSWKNYRHTQHNDVSVDTQSQNTQKSFAHKYANKFLGQTHHHSWKNYRHMQHNDVSVDGSHIQRWSHTIIYHNITTVLQLPTVTHCTSLWPRINRPYQGSATF
jgi:hypothetical protein